LEKGDRKRKLFTDVETSKKNKTTETSISIDEDGYKRSFIINKIGTYRSLGHADGRAVYMGQRGGLYYLGLNGWKTYIQSGQVIYSQKV